MLNVASAILRLTFAHLPDHSQNASADSQPTANHWTRGDSNQSLDARLVGVRSSCNFRLEEISNKAPKATLTKSHDSFEDGSDQTAGHPSADGAANDSFWSATRASWQGTNGINGKRYAKTGERQFVRLIFRFGTSLSGSLIDHR